MLTTIILTFNEEQHIARAVESVRDVCDRFLVVDSGSTDRTCEIARELGCEVLTNPWVNYAMQFNWALEKLGDLDTWILRLDADEYVTPKLASELMQHLNALDDRVDGVFVSRRMTFLRRPIRHGGVFPVHVLRLFRLGKGRCENRWMDEHIKVSGRTEKFDGELIDDNVNSLSWWTQKHNSYASREVIDLLNLEFGFMPHDTVADLAGGQQAGVKRWIKENLYPLFPKWRRF